jgi:site-specific recombinase XerD
MRYIKIKLEKEKNIMDFQINNQQQFDFRLQEFLVDLKKREYSEATVNGYKTYIKKTWSYILHADVPYTLKTSQLFGNEIAPGLPLSESSKKHIRTSIRRFNDYLSEQPYVFRQSSGHEEPHKIFQKVLDDYLEEMYAHGLKPTTIENRRIFATQFLNSVYRQGIRALNEISGMHVGVSVLSAGSTEGTCQKLPHFLKYLREKRLTNLDLYKAVPAFIPEKKLPSVYDKNELLQILSYIDCNCLSGKRDYAIMLVLVTYGLRAKDLAELKIENIDFQHCCISFKQSKTGNLYQAKLLPIVQEALEIYLSVINPSLENKPVFRSIHAPYRPLSRSAVWSIVSTRIKSSVETRGRKQGSHAIRSSMASGLVANDVPYPVVQKILGHSDPNATKRYVAIDIERLRKCSIECPEATGRFLSYLEGGEWK